MYSSSTDYYVNSYPCSKITLTINVCFYKCSAVVTCDNTQLQDCTISALDARSHKLSLQL